MLDTIRSFEFAISVYNKFAEDSIAFLISLQKFSTVAFPQVSPSIPQIFFENLLLVKGASVF